MSMEKPFKNIISAWTLYEGRIIGKVRYAQPSASVEAGDTIHTSAVLRIYLEDGKRVGVTRNSIYWLED